MPDTITDDLDALLTVLPPRVRDALSRLEHPLDLLEIVLDLGRLPEARLLQGEVSLSDTPVARADLDYVTARLGEFGGDNRAGIERTLHRISALRNRRGEVIGLTCRVGRAVRGTVALIRDALEQGRSILILGRPGVGKTTLLREAARVLADEVGKRVVVVDTSNEIAGDGDIAHPGIGRARRMQVARPAEQHAVMIEAVENHMPEVIVIDEIGTELEAQAARTIAERGVQLVGTAHGRTLDNLLVNPTLADLIGGIQAVTLSDEEARRRGTQKTVLERKAPPTFDVLVEQKSWREVVVHLDVAQAVDDLLRGYSLAAEHRCRDEHDRVHSERIIVEPAAQSASGEHASLGSAHLAPSEARSSRRQRVGSVAQHERSRVARLLEDPRHLQEEPEWSEQLDLEAAEPTGTSGILATRGLRGKRRAPLRIYPFGVSRERLEQSARRMHVPVEISASEHQADAVITLKTFYRRQAERLREAESARKPIYVLRTSSEQQLQQCLARIFDLRQTAEEHARGQQSSQTLEVLQATEDAVHQVLNNGLRSYDLHPQNAYLRGLQHRIAGRYNLESRSYGREPNRHVKLFAR